MLSRDRLDEIQDVYRRRYGKAYPEVHELAEYVRLLLAVEVAARNTREIAPSAKR